jgi:hypothetical protein
MPDRCSRPDQTELTTPTVTVPLVPADDLGRAVSATDDPCRHHPAPADRPNRPMPPPTTCLVWPAHAPPTDPAYYSQAQPSHLPPQRRSSSSPAHPTSYVTSSLDDPPDSAYPTAFAEPVPTTRTSQLSDLTSRVPPGLPCSTSSASSHPNRPRLVAASRAVPAPFPTSQPPSPTPVDCPPPTPAPTRLSTSPMPPYAHRDPTTPSDSTHTVPLCRTPPVPTQPFDWSFPANTLPIHRDWPPRPNTCPADEPLCFPSHLPLRDVPTRSEPAPSRSTHPTPPDPTTRQIQPRQTCSTALDTPVPASPDHPTVSPEPTCFVPRRLPSPTFAPSRLTTSSPKSDRRVRHTLPSRTSASPSDDPRASRASPVDTPQL